jgi:hypothetical protein
MTGLSFKSAVFSLVIVCFLSGSAVADTFTFTGSAFLDENNTDFDLSGPSFLIGSSRFGGPSNFFGCTEGTLCTIPQQVIPTIPSFLNGPGENSTGTVGGVKADTLLGALTFSSFSFIADPDAISAPPVTVTGDLMGYVFLPLGCEADFSCTAVGPQVFDLQISGSGTATFSDSPRAPLVIHGFEFTFSGTATTVTPEPSSLVLLSSGLIGLAAIRRWHLLRRVNH